MSEYLFIDGAYLREAFAGTMRQFYDDVPDIDFRNLRRVLGNFDRIYYYDAVDRSPVGAETREQTESRIREQDDFHAYLNSLNLWHVREGFVSRGRRATRRSQKAVDVQLAVDALEHAAAKNITRATFLFGDLDFEPLLFSLSRLGVRTTVVYERTSASPALLEAADLREQLTVAIFHNMAVPDWRERFTPAPSFSMGGNRPDQYLHVNAGRWGNRSIELLTGRDSHFLWVPPGANAVRTPSIVVHYPAHDQEKIVLAFVLTYGGTIEWTT